MFLLNSGHVYNKFWPCLYKIVVMFLLNSGHVYLNSGNVFTNLVNKKQECGWQKEKRWEELKRNGNCEKGKFAARIHYLVYYC